MKSVNRMTASSSADAQLVRAIGTRELTASIINVTIASSIFLMPATVAGRLGAAAPIAYLVCAALMTLIALCFAAAGSRVSLTGGLYAYIDTAFGGFAGFLGGYLYSVTACLSVASVATAFAGTVGVLWPAFATGPAPCAAAGGAVCGAGRGERARHQTRHPSRRSHHGREADPAAGSRGRRRVVGEFRISAHVDANGLAGGAGVDRSAVRVRRRRSGADAVGRNPRSGPDRAALDPHRARGCDVDLPRGSDRCAGHARSRAAALQRCAAGRDGRRDCSARARS